MFSVLACIGRRTLRLTLVRIDCATVYVLIKYVSNKIHVQTVTQKLKIFISCVLVFLLSGHSFKVSIYDRVSFPQTYENPYHIDTSTKA
jgi:hypothetical protein